MKPVVLASKSEIKVFLDTHDSWSLKNQKLHREYVFKDFVEAFGFMSQIALISERMNHHPEWCNVYKHLIVDLTTHEVGGVSQRDFDLARKMDQISLNLIQIT